MKKGEYIRQIIPVIVVVMIFSAMPPVAASSSTYVVNLLVAYDEEFTHTANWIYWYSPESLASIIIDETFYYFYVTFDVYYNIIAYESWDSDDDVTDPDGMLDEVWAETGFESGMEIGGYRVDVLVAFTDQNIQGCYGYSDNEFGVVLVEETYPCGVGQATDNVLQHELSHLYLAVDHWENDLDCVLNCYPYWIGFPWNYHVPTALVTNNWCTDCKEIISSNREMWGEPGVVGGCPTLFVWNGEQYVKEATLDIHGYSDVTVQHDIEQTVVLEKIFCKLLLVELDRFTSHIDYVKLYAIDSAGEIHLCYLVRAIHSELGNVERLLRFDDDRRVDLTPSQTIRLKFILFNVDDIAYFLFEINGYNPKPIPEPY